jgi:glycosyltransferase involved in cell wall biosynthesis
MLRVLHVHSGNLYGGVETCLSVMAGLGERCGVEFEFALCFEGRSSAELRAAGARVKMLGEARFRQPRRIVAARKVLRDLLAERSFDAVIVHNVWGLILFGSTVRRAGVRLVFHVRGTLGDSRSMLEQLARFEACDLIVCNSRFTASTVDRVFRGARREVAYNPVRLKPVAADARARKRQELGLDDDTVLITQVSRMEPWKGHLLHLEALAGLRTRKKWVCLIVGGSQRAEEDAYVASVHALAARLGIAENVRFLGDRSDVAEILAASDIFCQPNTGPEPFGNVFVEALIAGLPVVTTAMGGALEIVNPSCGILCPPGDVAKITIALDTLIDDAELRRRMAGPARQRARDISDPETQIRHYRDVIASVVRPAGTLELIPGPAASGAIVSSTRCGIRSCVSLSSSR